MQDTIVVSERKWSEEVIEMYHAFNVYCKQYTLCESLNNHACAKSLKALSLIERWDSSFSAM